MAAKIKKGDKVVVLTGRDKGMQGEVLKVFPTEGRVTVSGINTVTKHRKPSQASAGGIEKIEAPLAVSNVAYLDPQDGKPTRVGFKILADGTKVRFAKRSGVQIDA